MTVCARALSSYLVRSLPTGPFVGARLGSSDACYRKGVWEPTGQRTGDGGWGQKDEGNVLEPNNQHVDVFTGWPSSRVVAGHSRSPGVPRAAFCGRMNELRPLSHGTRGIEFRD